MRKKVEYFKDKLADGNGGEDEHTDSENEDDDEEVADVQPKKKNIKAQRAGVSAEVYGDWNKKGDFVPKVIKKSPETVSKL